MGHEDLYAKLGHLIRRCQQIVVSIADLPRGGRRIQGGNRGIREQGTLRGGHRAGAPAAGGEGVAHQGRFHGFPKTTSLPRPTQKPHPPFWVAALGTPESFTNAGRKGYSIMAIPMAGGTMAELIGLYREGWKSAGHPGKGRVMLAFHMFCHEDRLAAAGIARAPLERYLRSLVEAAGDWTEGTTSADYPGYDKIIAGLAQETFESQVEKGAAWVGTPADICEQIADYQTRAGGFEIASLQVNFNTLSFDDARRSVELFGHEVIPRFT